MNGDEASGPASAPPAAPDGDWRWSIRRIPVGWRVPLLVALNLVVFLILAAVIWHGNRVLGGQWIEVQRITSEHRLFDGIENDAGGLQSQIHRYLEMPSESVLTDIGRLRGHLLAHLAGIGVFDAVTADGVARVVKASQQLLDGFEALRRLNAGIRALYRDRILRVGSEVSGLYGILDDVTHGSNALSWPSIAKSRENFGAALLAINAFYFSGDAEALNQAHRGLEAVTQTAPVIRDLAHGELEQRTVAALAERFAAIDAALAQLVADRARQTELLGTEIDGAQAQLVETIDRIAEQGREHLADAQARFEDAVLQVGAEVTVVGVVFLSVSILISLIVARSITRPLRALDGVIAAVAAGDFQRPVPDQDAPDQFGAVARTLATVRDHAESRRRGELALEAQERRWRVVLENSPVGITIIAADTLRRLYVNPRFVELLGAGSVERALAETYDSSFADPAEIPSLAERARRDGAVADYEIERRRADGTVWWCALYARHIEIDGKAAFIVWHDDITERREAEAALREAKERAEAALADLGTARRTLIESEKMASLGGLVAGVAHEINTPLGISLTSASLLADESRRLAAALETGVLRRSDLARFLDLALESSDLLLANSQRAADLIKSFKQVAVDQTSDDRRVFNLAEYIDEVLMSLRPRLKRSAASVAVSCPDDLVVEGYPGPLAQVLTNFVMNSLIHAYGPDQAGQLSIAVTRAASGEVCLVYGDDGKGIPEDVLPKIFDPFFTTNRGGGGGSGLGLNIVQNLVTQRLGGRIEVTSAPGRGASFTVHFPQVM